MFFVVMRIETIFNNFKKLFIIVFKFSINSIRHQRYINTSKKKSQIKALYDILKKERQ